jgi:hypothetical protein
MGDKGLDKVPTGSAESFRATEIRGVRLNKGRIEVVLTDQKAESIPQPRLTIIRSILRMWLHGLLLVPGGTRRAGKRSQFFYRAESNPVSFAEGSVYGPRFGNAHFSTADHGGCI